jgi:hypothetical protein
VPRLPEPDAVSEALGDGATAPATNGDGAEGAGEGDSGR